MSALVDFILGFVAFPFAAYQFAKDGDMPASKVTMFGAFVILSIRLSVLVWPYLRTFYLLLLLPLICFLGVICFYAEERIDDIAFKPELVVNFKDSNVLTKPRRKIIQRSLDAYYRYLTHEVGFHFTARNSPSRNLTGQCWQRGTSGRGATRVFVYLYPRNSSG